MTAVCGGGTSAVKPGLEAVVDYSSGLIAAILQLRNLKWAIPVLPLANIPTLTLANFCASDPPAMPTFTSAETAAVLGLNFGADFDSGIAKFRDMILHALWYDACECTSGTLDTFPTVTVPTGTPIFQPPVPATVEPCSEAAIIPYTRSAGGGPSFAGFVTNGLDLGKDFTIGVLTITVTASTGNFNVTTTVKQQTTDASVDGHIFTFVSGVGTITRTIAFDPVYPVWAISLTGGAGTGNRIVDVSAKYYCGGQVPGGTLTPCCPPDPSTQAYLDLLIKMVTLIQRQQVPFAYVPGTAHTGLSGQGELDVSGLIGAKVTITASNVFDVGVTEGEPDVLFTDSWINWGSADGYLARERLSATNTLSLPPLAGAYTKLAYSLAPGIVVTIQELVREP